MMYAHILAQQQQQLQQQQMQQLMVTPPAQVQQQQHAHQHRLHPPTRVLETGYFETMWLRRRDLIKVCVLSLAVLLAISAHSTAWHYLQDYVDVNGLTGGRELIVRLAYPVVIVTLLWNIKAFTR